LNLLLAKIYSILALSRHNIVKGANLTWESVFGAQENEGVWLPSDGKSADGQRVDNSSPNTFIWARI
jgi:hypothetical protein